MKNSDSRKDTASRLIIAPARKIYQAFLDRDAITSWRPPEGMSCKIYEFDPHEGGSFRISFVYNETSQDVQGKSNEHEDIFHGRFVELIPNERIVESITFESDDPAFAGEMTMTTTFNSVPGGTNVTFTATQVPPGIKPADHHEGMMSSLKNLAAYIEQ